MNEKQMALDLDCPSIQEALGIDTESDRRWFDIQAEDIDTEMMDQEVTRWEWDAILEERQFEKRMAIALGECG